MNKITLILNLFICFNAWTQEAEKIADANTISFESPEKNKKLDLSEDLKKMSISALTGAFPEDFGSLTNLEFNFSFKLSQYWLSSFVGQGESPFHDLTENSSALNSSDSEGFLNRTEDNTVSFLQMGIGLGLRSQIFNWMFETKNFYETTSGYLAYMIMEEDLAPKEYGGFGVRADYALNYRMTERTHIAAKLSYRFHSLIRPEEFRDQDSDERTLALSWLSSGLELAYFF